MTLWDILSILCCLAGGVFFLAGTFGLLRFPNAMCRLHAITKADNLGLGFIVVGLAIRSPALPVIVKLMLIWLTVMLVSSTACYLLGNIILEEENNEGEKL